MKKTTSKKATSIKKQQPKIYKKIEIKTTPMENKNQKTNLEILKEIKEKIINNGEKVTTEIINEGEQALKKGGKLINSLLEKISNKI